MYHVFAHPGIHEYLIVTPNYNSCWYSKYYCHVGVEKRIQSVPQADQILLIIPVVKDNTVLIYKYFITLH